MFLDFLNSPSEIKCPGLNFNSVYFCISELKCKNIPNPKRKIIMDISQFGTTTILPLLKYPETIIQGEIQYRDNPKSIIITIVRIVKDGVRKP